MRFLLISVVMFAMLLPAAQTQNDAARMEWMGGFVKMEAADRLAENNAVASLEQYKGALEVFESVRRKYPQWNPSLLNYRIDYCLKRIQELTKALENRSDSMNKDELTALTRQQAKEIQTLEGVRRDLTSRVELLTQALQRARAESAAASNLEGSLASLTEAKKALEQEKAALELKLKAAEQRAAAAGIVEKLRQETEELRTQLMQREHELANARNQIHILETRLLAAEKEHKSLQLTAAKSQEAFAALTALSNSRRSEIDALMNAQKTHLAKIDEQAKYAAQLANELETIKRQLTQAQLESNELRYLRLTDSRTMEEIREDTQKAAQGEIAELKKETILLNEHLKTTQRELAERNEELRKLRETASSDRTRAVLKEDENMTLTAEMARVRQQMSLVEQKNLALTNRITELGVLLDKARSDVSEGAKELEKKRVELAKAAEQERQLQEQATLIRAQEQRLAEAQKAEAERTQELERLKRERDAAASSVRLLSAKSEATAGLTANLEEARRQSETLRAERDSLLNRADVLKRQVDELTANLAEKEQTIRRMGTGAVGSDALAAKVKELDGKLAAENRRRIQLENALLKMEEKLNDAGKEAARLPVQEEKNPAESPQERVMVVNALLKQAADAERQNRLEAARYNYQKALELDPDCKTALQRLGLIAASLGNDAEASRNLRLAFKHDPDDVDTLVALGFSQARLGKAASAVSYLARAVSLEPDNRTAAKYFGAALSTLGWNQAAVTELTRAYRLDPKDTEAPFNLAVLYATATPPDVANARKWYEIAIRNGAQPDPGLDQALKMQRN